MVVVEDVGFGLAAVEEVALERVEVRRDAVPRVDVRRLSSSETDEAGRWPDEVAVVDVRLAAVEVVVGRVGGLLRPPVAVPVRVDELAEGLVAVEEVAGRRAVVVVVAGFLAAEVAVFVPVVEAGFFTGAAPVAGAGDWGFSAEASAGGASAAEDSAAAAAEASAGASEGASSC